MSPVLAAAERFLRQLQGNPLVVAVSGGADSVAMLRAMAEAGGTQLTVAHFNHRLRGTESDGDADFVRELAEQLRVPVRIGSGNVQQLAEERRANLEATARELRYEWLRETATALGATCIATAHTADDQAETVLHRMIRGTGVQGLRGIANSRYLGGTVFVVRPLLGVTRADIEHYLAERQQPYRVDSTNADVAFTRNRIRHELLPLLKTFNPDIVAALGRLAEQADQVTDYLREMATLALEQIEQPRAGNRVILDGRKASVFHPYLLREVARIIWGREDWPVGMMTAEHWTRIENHLRFPQPAADFPGQVHIRRVGHFVQLERRSVG